LLKTRSRIYKHETGARQVTCDKYHVLEAVRHHAGKSTLSTCRVTTTRRKTCCKVHRLPRILIYLRLHHCNCPLRCQGQARRTTWIHVLEKRQAPAGSALAGKKASRVEKRPVAPITQAWSFPDVGALEKKLKICQDYITPACLQALYEIPAAAGNVQNIPLGIVEYAPEFFSQSDLICSSATSARSRLPPILRTSTTLASAQPQIPPEANLDLEYAMALV